MDFFKGDRVRCLGRPDWGSGQVQKNSADGKVWVEFERAGSKLLIIRFAKLLKVKPAAQLSATHRRSLQATTSEQH